MHPRSLTQREKYLIHLYCNCKFEMTPQEFYRKWEVNQEEIAEICSRSVSTVRYWFAVLSFLSSSSCTGFTTSGFDGLFTRVF